MKLNVPLIRQPKDSVDCGIAGVSMLLAYYGIKKRFSDIKKEISVDKTGTYAPQLGSYLIRQGFKVEIITLHPKLFTLKDKGMSQDKVLTRLKGLQKNTKNSQDKKVLNYFIEFMKAGGKIKVKIPDINDIKKEIRSKSPLGAVMATNFLNAADKPRFNFHFNIITGFDTYYI